MRGDARPPSRAGRTVAVLFFLLTHTALCTAASALPADEVIQEAPAAALAPSQFEVVAAAVFGLTMAAILVLMITDNTSRKKAEAALREALQRLELHAESSPLAVIEFDRDYRVTRWSRRAEEIFGWSSEEILGRRLEEVRCIHEEDFTRIEERAAAISAGLQSRNININRNYRKDGSVITCEWYNSALRDARGQMTSVQSLVLDVTDRQRAEEEKQAMQRQLLQAQKMESVGRLAGGVAHDFNNMLCVILGCTELAVKAAGDDPRLLKHLRDIREAARRSAELTRQLLAFARRQVISLRVLDLNEAVTAMLAVLRRLIGEDIAIVWTPAMDLWPVKMDRNQVDQILTNLAVNARDAGTGALGIETRNVVVDEAASAVHQGLPPGDYVTLTVRDDGRGMDEATFSHLFEPFFTTKGQGKGTGLGLATVYGITKQNGGHIGARSAVGEGTTFEVLLPRSLEARDVAPTTGEETILLGNGERVLLVEDETSLLAIAKTMLEQLGYVVTATASSREALRLAEDPSARFDLLITDVVMPDMGGLELVERIGKAGRSIPCMLMSGYSDEILSRHGVADGEMPLLKKPFTLTELSVSVHGILHGASTGRGPVRDRTCT
jgi:two-component system, cell cycle sensor histidine kinase and response regulator CckA